jgi:hypothetical protein
MGGSTKTNGKLDPGVSIRFGPAGDGDVEMAEADGASGRGVSKRKSRASAAGKSYADPESSEEDKPLVRLDLSLIRICSGTSVADCFGRVSVVAHLAKRK